MKIEQLVVLLIIGVLLYALGCAFFNAYDEVTFEYDPSTGKQRMTGRKNRILEGPTPLTLEGE